VAPLSQETLKHPPAPLPAESAHRDGFDLVNSVVARYAQAPTRTNHSQQRKMNIPPIHDHKTTVGKLQMVAGSILFGKTD
jgi:hypothetical protein